MAEQQHGQRDGAVGEPEGQGLRDIRKWHRGIIEQATLRPAGGGQTHDHQHHAQGGGAEVRIRLRLAENKEA